MSYLTEDEYVSYGFELVNDFEKLEQRACVAIDLFTRHYYQLNSLEDEIEMKKAIVKKAVAFQILYLNDSGILTAEDKNAYSSVSIGRTSISYQNGSLSNSEASMYNLSIDSLNLLKSVGFNYLGVNYDR